jgi:hypothetical protein
MHFPQLFFCLNSCQLSTESLPETLPLIWGVSGQGPCYRNYCQHCIRTRTYHRHQLHRTRTFHLFESKRQRPSTLFPFSLTRTRPNIVFGPAGCLIFECYFFYSSHFRSTSEPPLCIPDASNLHRVHCTRAGAGGETEKA